MKKAAATAFEGGRIVRHPLLVQGGTEHGLQIQVQGEVAQVRLGQGEGFLRLTGDRGWMGGARWHEGAYLVLDLINEQMESEKLFVRFYEKGEAECRMMLTLAIFPRVMSRAVFALKWTDSNIRFPPLYPGTLKSSVSGDALDLGRVDRVEIGFFKGYMEKERHFRVFDAYLTEESPEPLPCDRVNCDRFGQWTEKEWPGKIHSEAELKTRLSEELSRQRNLPALGTYHSQLPPAHRATGFFRVEKVAGRWLLIDPKGCPFFSVGVFGVYPGEPGWVRGVEGYHEWLPPMMGEYAEAWDRAGDLDLYRRKFSGMFPDDTGLFSFTTANFIRAFGSDWRKAWTQLTAARLKDWGINTLSMFSDPAFIMASRMPYVRMLERFPVTKRCIFDVFPDVFSPEYDEACRAYAEPLRDTRNDPFLIGYFLNNEPAWAFVHNLVLAEKLLESGVDTYSRRALIAWLREQYGDDIERLNEAWQTAYGCFGDLEAKQPMRLSERGGGIRRDLMAFSERMIDAYARIPAHHARLADPNHLNLGMRFAGFRERDPLLVTAKYFDVYSFNAYTDDAVPAMEKLTELIDLPMLIGEFHFGALDRGLPAPSLFCVESQEARGEAYARYVGRLAQNKNAIGAHYFAYNDQPLWGRYDGENYQFGFTDICGLPHEAFVSAAADVNRHIYDIMAGKRQPLAGETRRL